MRKLTTVFLLTFAACATGSVKQAADLNVPKVVPNSARVYTGNDGISVTVVTLEDGSRLAHLIGVPSPMAGKVVRVTLKQQSSTLNVNVTEVDGSDRWFLHEKTSRYGGGGITYKLYSPGAGRAFQGVDLGFDEKRSKAVKIDELWEKHREQLADGTLTELARFKRDKEEAEEIEELTKNMAYANKVCGTNIKVSIDWKTISDDVLKELSISGYCGPAMAALRSACKFSSAKAVIKDEVKEIRCANGAERGLEVKKGVLHWTMAKGSSNNDQYAVKALHETSTLGKGKNLARRIFFERARVCAGGRSVYVGAYPNRKQDESKGQRLRTFYGKDGKFFGVDLPRQMTAHYFFDPRFQTRQKSRWYRGHDMKFMSSAEIDDEKKRCIVTCGKRKVELEFVDEQTKTKVIANAPFEQTGPKRVPYGLARDRRGVYYFVDRGPERNSRDFHLYVGKVGRLKRMRMVNVVSDSEGDVFATKSGSLRLVLEKPNSFWMRRGRAKRRLINVPINQNWGLVYNDLGPYLGASYGTPCDVL